MTADRLETYNRKRDFSRTAEPRGAVRTSGRRRFVVQKHAARRLHWDFRLEIDGVLVSWAVPKGPSLDPDEKRLAVRTEDHPLDYAEFEGDIPAGEYGAGHVDIWDEGTWDPIGLSAADQLAKGHLHIRLHGNRLQGEWNLVHMQRRAGEKRENWLLVKIEDDQADPQTDLVALYPGSVRQAQKREPKRGERAAPKSKGLGFVPLQLATLTDKVPLGAGWLHEMKYDGYRCLLVVDQGEAVAYTRSGLDWSAKFPPIVDAARQLDVQSALIDGEVVILDEHGRPDFAALQAAIKAGRGNFILMAFDLLALNGRALRPLPLIERKTELCRLMEGQAGAVRYADHVIGEGQALFDGMCAAGLEGIISKRIDAPYLGQRTPSWLKVKCALREEFVIAGWTETEAKDRPFGALALAQYENGTLVYRGRVGTGFGRVRQTGLDTALARLPKAPPPKGVPPAAARGVHWVDPKLVAEIAYATRTADGLVRHARFIGLRADKPAKNVEKEVVMADAPDTGRIVITHPERVVFPETGATKGDVADYYEAIAPLMLASTGGRPISLIRCPDNIAGDCFFQRHETGGLDVAAHHVDVADSAGKLRSYLYVSDVRGLLSCVQMGAIEFHGWGAKARTIDQVDRIVFDLDPDEGLRFSDVRKAAMDLRNHLQNLGLESRPLLSGGKGIHVIVPLDPPVDWDTAKSFARGFAQTLAEVEPDRYVATASKAKRKGRIFIDWLRNQKGATSVEPYSLRARAGAPVAAPVNWSDLARLTSPSRYSIKDRALLIRRADGLKDWQLCQQSLPGAASGTLRRKSG